MALEVSERVVHGLIGWEGIGLGVRNRHQETEGREIQRNCVIPKG